MCRSIMLPGVSVHDINKMIDERGFFAEIMRSDWKDFLGDDRIAQANLSLSNPGMIRVFSIRKRQSLSTGTSLPTNSNLGDSRIDSFLGTLLVPSSPESPLQR